MSPYECKASKKTNEDMVATVYRGKTTNAYTREIDVLSCNKNHGDQLTQC